MKAGAVVEHLDILEHCHACGFAAGEGFAVADFQFQRGEETLSHRIVVRHARAAHAQPDFRILRFCPVSRAGVLAAAVVVQGQAWPWTSVLKRHIECALGQVDSLVIVHGPANHAPAVDVHDGGQVQHPLARRQLGDVADPGQDRWRRTATPASAARRA